MKLKLGMLLFAFYFLCMTLGVCLAQGATQYTCSNTIPSTDHDFEQWVNEEVKWIISDLEKKSFINLKLSEEKLSFIAFFWLRRDTNPDTEENEFQTEHCERLRSTEQFTSGDPGWRTDRGRVLIILGPPDRVQTGKKQHEWDGKINDGITYERWYYDHVFGLGTNIQLTFIDPAGSNEFALTEQDKERIMPFFEATQKGLSMTDQ